MRKLCKKYVELYEALDTNNESLANRRFNFNNKEREEYTIRFDESFKHFENLEDN
jgi:hypothetical protein